MNIALLGYGSIARSHVRAIEALRVTASGADLRVYGVMGRLAESTAAFAREFAGGLDTILVIARGLRRSASPQLQLFVALTVPILVTATAAVLPFESVFVHNGHQVLAQLSETV